MLGKLLENPERPFAAILGGAKVSDKIGVIEHLLTKVDVLVLGGGMANTFLLAQGKSVGKSLAEHDRVDDARQLLALAEKRGVQVVVPIDVVIAKEVTRGTEYKTVGTEKFPASLAHRRSRRAEPDGDRGGPGRREDGALERPARRVRDPVVRPRHDRRSPAILADRAEAGVTVVVGGGDCVAAIEQQGLAGKFTHISTGGGASLEFLEGRELPGIAVLQDRPPSEAKPKAKPRKAAVGSGAKASNTLIDGRRRPRDPRLARQSDRRGRRRPRRRLGRPGGGAVGRLDRRPRGGRAARRRQEPLRRQGRPDARSAT